MADRISYGPITLFESDAYKRAKQVEATKREIDLEKAQLDLQRSRQELSKAEGETLSGRVGQADIAASVLEQARQKRMGVEIGQEIGREATKAGGLSLLEATGKQAGINLDLAREQARLGAVEQYGIEKGLTPTAKVDVGGITQTVPASAAARTSAEILKQVFNVRVPVATEGYIARGYDPETARKLAMENTMEKLMNDEGKGKVTILSADGTTTKTYSDSEARLALKDPDVPENIKEQIRAFIGPVKQSTAPSWINTRLGR